MTRSIITVAAAVVATGIVAVPAGAEPAGPEPGPPPGPPPPAGAAEAEGQSPAPAEIAAAIEADGSYAVGTEILPGIYSSAGPVPDDVCYWRRAGVDGTTLSNAMTKQPQVVQIDPADATFTTRGCQPWQLTDGAPPTGQTPPWLAQLQLRHHLDILNGLAGQSGNGQLPPY